MKAAIPALLLACAGASAAPPPLTPDDFAFGYDIALEGEAAIYRLRLPQDVYARIAHDDLSDIRVFNAAGEPVPHMLRRPAPDGAPEEQSAELTFFPLPVSRDDPTRPLSVQVTRDARGAVVRVEDAAAIAPDGRPEAYLIDTSALERLPDALELEWNDTQANFTAEVGVSGSNDLVGWNPLVARASVARLHFAGRSLEQRRVEIPRGKYRYLRLDWPSSTGATTLIRVTGRFREPLPEIGRGWVVLEGTRAKGDKPTFDYELPGHSPIDRVGLALPPGNSLIAATVSSRTRDGKWLVRHRGTFYRISVDGSELVREDASIGTTRAPHWQVELEKDSGTAPRLRLGWVLDDLYFLARGEGPYTLAYGAATAPAGNTPVGDLLARLDGNDAERFISTADAAAPRVLGGEARLTPPSNGLPWDRILLWSVLVLGVIGLGVMAWRLWRQMQETPPS